MIMKNKFLANWFNIIEVTIQSFTKLSTKNAFQYFMNHVTALEYF